MHEDRDRLFGGAAKWAYPARVDNAMLPCCNLAAADRRAPTGAPLIPSHCLNHRGTALTMLTGKPTIALSVPAGMDGTGRHVRSGAGPDRERGLKQR